MTVTTGVGSETLTYSSAASNNAHVATSGKYINAITLADGSNGGVATNYALPTLNASNAAVTISTKTLTPTITNSGYSQTYDGATTADITPTYSFSGLISGDSAATLGNTGKVYNSKDVASANQITVSGLGISSITGSNSSDASDYTLDASSKTVSATVTRKTVTLSASKTYDGSTSLTGDVTVTTGVGSETLTYSSAASNNAHVATSGKYINAITLADGSNGGVATNYALPTLNASNAAVTISTKTLTPTITNSGYSQTYDGATTADITPTYSFSGLISGDSAATLGNTGKVYNSKDVASANQITVSGLGISSITGSNSSDASDYTLDASSKTVGATITKKNLAISYAGSDKVYNGTSSASVAESVTGIVTGDTVTVSEGAAFANKNVGSGKTVSISSISLGGASSGNYSTSTTANTTADITKKPVTFSYTAANKVYDGGVSATVTESITGKISGDTLSLGETGVFASKTVATGKTVNISSIVLAGADAGNYSIASTTDTATASVTVKTLTATYSGVNKVYDGTTSATTTKTDNRVSGDTLTITESAAFANKNVGSSKAITVSSLGVSGTDAGNYTLASPAGSPAANISKKSLTLAGSSSVSKTYDGTTAMPSGVTGHGSLTGKVSGDDVNLSGVAVYDATTAGARTVTQGSVVVAGADTGNYAFSWTNGGGSISKAALTITADNDAKFVTESDTSGFKGVNYSGFVNGEGAGVLGGSLAVSRSNSSVESAGSYSGVLVPGNVTATNYNITFVNGDFTIVAADQLLVTVSDLNTTYGAAPTYVVSSAKYKKGSTIVDLSSSVSASGNAITITDGASGNATFTLSALSGVNSTGGHLKIGNYSIGSTSVTETSANFSNTITFAGNHTVAKKALTPGVGGVSKIYDGSTSMTGLTLSLPGRASGDSLNVSGTGNFAGKNAGSSLNYTVKDMALSGTDVGNYYLSGGSTATGSSGVIAKKAVTLTGPTASRVYNGGTGYTATAGDLNALSGALGVSGDSVSAITLTYNNKNAATGKTLTPSSAMIADDNSGNNYAVTYVANTASAITRLNSVTWAGGATGDWFNPSNWTGGAVPDLSNVANVVIPNGKTITFDNTSLSGLASGGTVNVNSIGSNGGLVMNNGRLNGGSGGVTLDTFGQTGGTLDVTGGFTVKDGFSQGASGTTTVAGPTTITDAAGGITLGNLITNGSSSASSNGGSITQSSGTTLTANSSSSFTAKNTDGSKANINLGLNGNNFVGGLSVDGQRVTIKDTVGGLSLGDVTTGGVSTFTTTNGKISQVTGGSIESKTEVTFSAKKSALPAIIELKNPANDFKAAVNADGRDVELHDKNALVLGDIAASGILDVSAKDNVTRAAGKTINVIGAATIKSTIGSITLGGGNSFAGGLTKVLKVAASSNTVVRLPRIKANLPKLRSQPAALVVDANVAPAAQAFSPAAGGGASGGGDAGGSDAGSGGTSGAGGKGGLSVELIRQATGVQPGIVSVSIPKETATRGTGFSFALPQRIAVQADSTNNQVKVAMPNGAPLPDWLKFEPESMSFVASAVPDGAFPVQVVVSVNGQQNTVVISEQAEE